MNNIYVSAQNLGLDAHAYIAGLPAAQRARDPSSPGTRATAGVLIDDHGSQVCEEVWELYRLAIARFGPLPTLVEWDNNIPSLATLVAESQRARRILEERRGLAA